MHAPLYSSALQNLEMAELIKIVIEMHEGEQTTKKIWRFDGDNLNCYSKDGICCEIQELFPHICRKGLHLEFRHYDGLAGKVNIESNGDLKEALENFLSEWRSGGRRKEISSSACQ